MRHLLDRFDHEVALIAATFVYSVDEMLALCTRFTSQLAH